MFCVYYSESQVDVNNVLFYIIKYHYTHTMCTNDIKKWRLLISKQMISFTKLNDTHILHPLAS